MDAHTLQELKDSIRTIPDYPKPGIMFRDITTLLGNARAFRRVVDELVQPWSSAQVDRVAGIEARGFLLGGAPPPPGGPRFRAHPQERQAPAHHRAARLFAGIWRRRDRDPPGR